MKKIGVIYESTNSGVIEHYPPYPNLDKRVFLPEMKEEERIKQKSAFLKEQAKIKDRENYPLLKDIKA